ncbi:gustatory receptor for sugar taste 64a-like [Copidosoma floridanum]|uniref:gustatory receptor for sugar taste 64a-like n=1 Tax=Copidosoma floridanum TaxID=29053 RepID=UPI000C6FAA9C|nr:gustatory receptor for sugar taste 64a-like [Copidosoma floridanum]
MMLLFGNSKNNASRKRSINPIIFPKLHSLKRTSPQLFRRQSPDDSDDPECFHRAIGGILLLAQFFGILPIYYVRADTVEKMSFRKYTPRNFYAYFVFIGVCFMTVVSIVHMITTLGTISFQTRGGIADATVGAIFYGNSLLGNILFLRLCPRWITMQYDWRAMERVIDNRGKWSRPRLRARFKIIAGAILGLALLEHVLSVINNTPNELWGGNHTFEDWLDVYTNRSHAFILKHVDYNFTFGLFILFVSRVATFTWNFTDLFVILVATGIADRYKHLNKRIMRATPRELTFMDWHEIRECYAVLSALVKKVDSEISGIVLLSFINNIYFICLQLMNGLTPSESEHSIVNSLYFFGSFFFLIGRSVCVTLMTARINDECKIILPVLYNCPSVNYSLEAQRLQHQIASDDIALTGHRFFSITRNFMLAVAGAIVTYEIVLLQFNIAMQ